MFICYYMHRILASWYHNEYLHLAHTAVPSLDTSMTHSTATGIHVAIQFSRTSELSITP